MSHDAQTMFLVLGAIGFFLPRTAWTILASVMLVQLAGGH